MAKACSLDKLVRSLRDRAPTLTAEIDHEAERLFAEVVGPGSKGEGGGVFDSDLGYIRLSALEIALLHTPLITRQASLQRNAAIACVYPSFTHTQLQFTLAATGWTKRQLVALSATSSGPPGQFHEMDHIAIVLTTLVKGVASGPYGEALWPSLERSYGHEISDAGFILAKEFESTQRGDLGAVLAVLIILSPGFVAFLERNRVESATAKQLATTMAALLLGSGNLLKTPALSGLVRGPLSAERVATVIQDCRAASIQHSLDTDYLLHSLSLVALNGADSDIGPATSSSEVALVLREAGLRALEDLALAETLLGGRVVNHPTVRLVARMAERLAASQADTIAGGTRVSHLFGQVNDYAWVSEATQTPGDSPQAEATRRIAQKLLTRNLPKPVLAFGPNYLVADAVEPQDRADQSAMIMRDMLRALDDAAKLSSMEAAIANEARKHGADKSATAQTDVFIGFPRSNWSGAGRVFVQTKMGRIELASDRFDLAVWDTAYRSSKWAGRVYGDLSSDEDIEPAARSLFEREFGLRLSDAATLIALPRSSLPLLPDYFPAEDKTKLPRRTSGESPYIRAQDIRLPSGWSGTSPRTSQRIARRLRVARPKGYRPEEKQAILRLIDALTSFQALAYAGGTLQMLEPGNERALQQKLRDHLRSRDFNIAEGMKVGGGEIDLFFEDEIVVEIKIARRATDDPFDADPRFGLQARRYGLALEKEIVATFVGYKPSSELGHYPAPDLLDIVRMPDERFVEIRAWAPLGFPLPSRVKRLSGVK